MVPGSAGAQALAQARESTRRCDMRWRRGAVIAMAGAMALVLSACGGNPSSSGGGKNLTIGFVPGIASDPFFLAMRLGAEAEAKKLGVKLLWQGAAKEYSPQSEIPFVDSMLVQHIDGLALVATDPHAPQPRRSRAP